MTFEPSAHLLAFVLPTSFAQGDVTFRSPLSDREVQVPIPPGKRPRREVSTASLTKGFWRAILHWSDGKLQYQEEKDIFVD